MVSLQKIAGYSSIAEGMIYISAFAYFGAFWAFPFDGEAIQKVSYLQAHKTELFITHLLMYIVFGCLLAILVVAIHEKLKQKCIGLMSIASLFGAIWVGLVIASGMISNIGLAASLSMATHNPSDALETWEILNIVVESIGGGNELVGGLWVLLLSGAAIKVKEFSAGVNYLGVFVGLAGVATVYPAEVLTEIFGVSQIVWFIWLGIVLLRDKQIVECV